MGTVVSSGITGLVGLAGIVGTAWQAKRGRQAASADLKTSLDAAAENLRAASSAEDQRAAEAAKRRAYAALLATYSSIGITAGDVLYSASAERHARNVDRMQAALDEMWNAAAQVKCPFTGGGLVSTPAALRDD